MKPISIEVCIKNILMQEGIGDIIRKELDRKGVKPSHFAEKMGFGRSNATNLLNRKDWPFSKIMQACEVLESNLFYYIIPSYENNDFKLLKESSPIYQSKKADDKLKECEERCRDLAEMTVVLKENNRLLREKLNKYENPDNKKG